VTGEEIHLSLRHSGGFQTLGDWFQMRCHSRGLHLVLLLVIVLVINWNTLGNHYVIDDEIYLINNTHFQDISYLPEYFTKGFCEGIQRKCAYYRPLIAISHLADFYLWGDHLWGYHLTNLIIHLSVVITLYLLVGWVFKNTRVAFISSIFFAVHPAHIESVAWIGNRSDPSAALFMLISFGFYYHTLKNSRDGFLGSYPGSSLLVNPQRGRVNPQRGRVNPQYWRVNPKWWKSPWTYLSLLFFSLALLAKEIAITLPLLLFSYEVLFGPEGRRWGPEVEKKQFYPYLPFFGMIVLYFFMRQNALGYLALGEEGSEGFWKGWLSVPIIIWEYFSLMLFPHPLVIFPPSPVIEDIWSISFLGGLLFLLGFGAGLIFLFRKNIKGAVFGGVWFLISLLPVLYIVAFSELGPNERYSYIPSIGFSLMVGFTADWVASMKYLKERSWAQRGLVTSLLAVLLIFGGLTMDRNQDWRDEAVLWKGHYALFPDSPKGHFNLANIYMRRGEYELAIEWYQAHARFFPNSSGAHFYVGLAYHQLGEIEKALEAYNRSLEKGEVDHLTFYNMGLIYMEKKQIPRAIQLLEMSIAVEPDYFWSHRALGEALGALGFFKEAISQLRVAVGLKPKDSYPHLLLSQYLQKVGKPLEAGRHHQIFLQLNKNGMMNSTVGVDEQFDKVHNR